jgi:hypothetical protein
MSRRALIRVVLLLWLGVTGVSCTQIAGFRYYPESVSSAQELIATVEEFAMSKGFQRYRIPEDFCSPCAGWQLDGIVIQVLSPRSQSSRLRVAISEKDRLSEKGNSVRRELEAYLRVKYGAVRVESL